MTTDRSYLLGHDATELTRLEAQHRVWGHTLLEALDGLGSLEGATVLDAGCGSGVLLPELADRVGPRGRVFGVERDPGAAAVAAGTVAGRPNVEVFTGDLEAVALPRPVDVVVSRWVFSFLPDPGRVLARLASALRAGGHVVIQDYVHDGMRVFPEDPAIARVVEALRETYRAHGGDLFVAGRLPALCAEAGLALVGLDPRVKAGPPGSEPWRWVERFLLAHVETMQDEGRLTEEEVAAFQGAWERVRDAPGAVLFTPLVVTVTARAPGAGEVP